MKKLFWLFVLLPILAQAQLYNPTVESGDTLVSNTVDTTTGCLIYNGSTADRRPIRPTIYIDVDEIGVNTTHYWMEIAVDVACSDRLPAEDDDGWYQIYRRTYNDWFGHGGSAQYNICIPLPQMEVYGMTYFRVRLNYPYGQAADSTAYAVYFCADENNNMYQVPAVNYRRISHYELFGTTAAAAINGTAAKESYAFDLMIEKTPGNFQIPTRVIVEAGGDAVKADADSLLIQIYGYNGLNKTTDIICTDTLAPFGTTCYAITPITLTTGFINSAYIKFTQMLSLADDTTKFYGDVQLYCDP
jgi:hypothetical protein